MLGVAEKIKIHFSKTIFANTLVSTSRNQTDYIKSLTLSVDTFEPGDSKKKAWHYERSLSCSLVVIPSTLARGISSVLLFFQCLEKIFFCL
jgi:hypothetical protein